MARFKINVELTGLKIQIEGSRDDVPLMAHAVGQQFAGLLAPAAEVVEGEIVDHKAVPLIQEQKPARKPSRRKPSASSGSANGSKPTTKDEAVDWRHDPSKWGNPQKDWSTSDKTLWILYVVANESSLSEMSTRQIVGTFNKHFHQAGQIQVYNVNRDLGNLKSKSPALVAENTTKEPSTWFLMPAGEKRVQELVNKATGQAMSV